MGLIKYIIELILITIIIFFVWNILKRLFFNAFYKNFPAFNPKNQQKTEQQSKKDKINWDAETVDYEEVNDKKEENS